MAKIRLNLLNIFALRVKKHSLEYDGDTVGQVLSQFFAEHKQSLQDLWVDKEEHGSPQHLLILLNGRVIPHSVIYQAPLISGDKITLSFPLSGG